MATTESNYPVIFDARFSGGLPRLRKYSIPEAGNRTLILRDGSTGFLLVHMATYFDRYIERLDVGTWDEWGYAVRPVRGQTAGYSNHSGGIAEDLNATRHPRGVPIEKTFTQHQINLIHRRLKMYGGCVRWGGDFHTTVDGMHFDINKPLAEVEKTAKRLMRTKIGKEVLDANPGLRKVILA